MKVKRLDPAAKLPTRTNPNDAGLDLYTLTGCSICPGDIVKLRTGIAIELPLGTVGLIWDRSSMGAKGLKVLGGVIDEGYRGELSVVLSNVNRSAQHIPAGSKVAQLLVQPVICPAVAEVEELTDSLRGTQGFGSSGV